MLPEQTLNTHYNEKDTERRLKAYREIQSSSQSVENFFRQALDNKYIKTFNSLHNQETLLEGM